MAPLKDVAIPEPPEYGGERQVAVTDLDMYLVDVEPEQFGRDLRRDRVGAGTQVGGRAAHERGYRRGGSTPWPGRVPGLT